MNNKRQLISVKRQTSNIKRQSQRLSVKYETSYVQWSKSNVEVKRQSLRVKCQISYANCQTSNVKHRTSYIKCQTLKLEFNVFIKDEIASDRVLVRIKNLSILNQDSLPSPNHINTKSPLYGDDRGIDFTIRPMVMAVPFL